MACWKTLGISSGRFRMDRVTPVMKYHVFDGRCGYVRRVWRRDGVMRDGSIADDMIQCLYRSYSEVAKLVIRQSS
jgi:hypothetical protein